MFYVCTSGSFSAVSTPIFGNKYSFFSIFRDLQDGHSFSPLTSLHAAHFSLGFLDCLYNKWLTKKNSANMRKCLKTEKYFRNIDISKNVDIEFSVIFYIRTSLGFLIFGPGTAQHISRPSGRDQLCGIAGIVEIAVRLTSGWGSTVGRYSKCSKVRSRLCRSRAVQLNIYFAAGR